MAVGDTLIRDQDAACYVRALASHKLPLRATGRFTRVAQADSLPHVETAHAQPPRSVQARLGQGRPARSSPLRRQPRFEGVAPRPAAAAKAPSFPALGCSAAYYDDAQRQMALQGCAPSDGLLRPAAEVARLPQAHFVLPAAVKRRLGLAAGPGPSRFAAPPLPDMEMEC